MFIAFILGLSLFQIIGLESSRYRNPSITQAEHDIGVWIDDNLPLDVRLTYIVDTSTNKGKHYWIGALSNRGLDWEKTRRIVVLDSLDYPNVAEFNEGGERYVVILYADGEEKIYSVLKEAGSYKVLRLIEF
jgi:hypothetical protein